MNTEYIEELIEYVEAMEQLDDLIEDEQIVLDEQLNIIQEGDKLNEKI